MLLRSLPLVLATLAVSAPAAGRQSAPGAAPSVIEGGVPWIADRALGTPRWLSVSGSVQTRFESMSNRLRRGETGSNQGFFNRVLTEFTLRDRFLELNAELIDARIFGEPDDATPTTGQVDTVDLLLRGNAVRTGGHLRQRAAHIDLHLGAIGPEGAHRADL